VKGKKRVSKATIGKNKPKEDGTRPKAVVNKYSPASRRAGGVGNWRGGKEHSCGRRSEENRKEKTNFLGQNEYVTPFT